MDVQVKHATASSVFSHIHSSMRPHLVQWAKRFIGDPVKDMGETERHDGALSGMVETGGRGGGWQWMKGDLRTRGRTRLWMDAMSVERAVAAPPCPSWLCREGGGGEQYRGWKVDRELELIPLFLPLLTHFSHCTDIFKAASLEHMDFLAQAWGSNKLLNDPHC